MPLFRKALRDLRWHVIGYGGGLAGLAMMYVFLYPTYADMLAEFELPEAYKAFVGTTDLASARGYLQTELFSMWVPLLLAIYAIVTSTGQTVGDEGSGTMEMVLAQPVSRRRLFLERATGLAVGAALICALTVLGFIVSVPFVDLRGDITLGELAVAPFGALLFGLTFIALSLLIGTLTPTRGQAAGLLTALVVLFYLMDVLPDLWTALDPLRYGSPFYYADMKRLLIEGVVPWHQAVLAAATVAFAALALAAFEAREIGTRRSPLADLLRRRPPLSERATP